MWQNQFRMAFDPAYAEAEELLRKSRSLRKKIILKALTDPRILLVYFLSGVFKSFVFNSAWGMLIPTVALLVSILATWIPEEIEEKRRIRKSVEGLTDW